MTAIMWVTPAALPVSEACKGQLLRGELQESAALSLIQQVQYWQFPVPQTDHSYCGRHYLQFKARYALINKRKGHGVLRRTLGNHVGACLANALHDAAATYEDAQVILLERDFGLWSLKSWEIRVWPCKDSPQKRIIPFQVQKLSSFRHPRF